MYKAVMPQALHQTIAEKQYTPPKEVEARVYREEERGKEEREGKVIV